MSRIVFTLPMVRALRAGLKTQTRRVSPPRFKIGDVVAVGEPCTVYIEDRFEQVSVRCKYAADDTSESRANYDAEEIARCSNMPTVINRTLRSGRYLPGWAERTRLRITAIEEQALGDITEADARAEGFADRAAFMAYFGTLHPGPVDPALPVWAIHFEVVT